MQEHAVQTEDLRPIRQGASHGVPQRIRASRIGYLGRRSSCSVTPALDYCVLAVAHLILERPFPQFERDW